MIAYEEEEMPKLSSSYQSHQPLHLSSFIRDVNYSCGSCGYELNLNSSNRNTTSLVNSNYGKSIKKKRKRSLISFFSVDETRFTHIQQFSFSWISFFNFQRTATATKLLCRNCGNHLGYARTFPSHSGSNSWDGISDSRTFYIKLNSIQPSSQS
ncbi:uncharacterized protein At4g08330, chloroplastic-like [Vicia villosa]|uniref:uncharacterized protein At4g08330, chloroplastic-like n=1 Tax=Vicia villosa TaxID=3911 RepID=UPI00273CC607|nr:uncharacterized protein At4g08330, chloroplastic-like [Vicia villosa]